MVEVNPSLITSMMVLAKSKNRSVIIQTGGTTIYGTPILYEDELGEDDSAIKVALETYKAVKKKDGIDIEEESSSDEAKKPPRQLIWLKDVTILSTTRVNLPFIVIFVNKVDAISIGNEIS